MHVCEHLLSKLKYPLHQQYNGDVLSLNALNNDFHGYHPWRISI